MQVVPYEKKYKKDFIELNKYWITHMFKIEKRDIEELNNIEKYIEQGGNIFFAKENDEILACCMVAPMADGSFELMKFAAKGMRSGKGAGTACLKACIEYAKEKNVPRIVIFTNTKCHEALHLYRKMGFKEIKVDKKDIQFERVDIVFELDLS